MDWTGGQDEKVPPGPTPEQAYTPILWWVQGGLVEVLGGTMILTKEVTSMPQEGEDVGFRGILYPDVQQSVSIAFKTKWKRSL